MLVLNIHTAPSVPGSEIVDDNQASEDVCVALRDAFDAGSNSQITRARCKDTRTK